jgi:hypothetical protein
MVQAPLGVATQLGSVVALAQRKVAIRPGSVVALAQRKAVIPLGSVMVQAPLGVATQLGSVTVLVLPEAVIAPGSADSRSRKMNVGWCHTPVEGVVAFPDPERLFLSKDPSPARRGPFSCPAVRATADGLFCIESPFSLKMRCRRVEDVLSFSPVYPFTTITESKLSEWFRIEPTSSWRSTSIPIFQMPSPYIFIADQKVDIEVMHPFLSPISSMNWRLIPGRFDIYGWQRPLNWAAEWDINGGDLVIRVGDPLYYIRFIDSQNKIISSPELVKVQYTKEIDQRVREISGVTSFRRGTMSLIRESASKRQSSLIVPVDRYE